MFSAIYPPSKGNKLILVKRDNTKKICLPIKLLFNSLLYTMALDLVTKHFLAYYININAKQLATISILDFIEKKQSEKTA